MNDSIIPHDVSPTKVKPISNGLGACLLTDMHREVVEVLAEDAVMGYLNTLEKLVYAELKRQGR